MFEGAVAAFLNRLLGRYVEDLDTEQFNVGIFSGETYLTDLKLKPEALYQLGLPIRIEIGIIGKVSLKIPWAGLFSQPIILCIEDIYIVTVPSMSGIYDPEIQKKLMRASKRKVLEDLEGDGLLRSGLPSGLLDNLMASVVKNFQITVNNVHVRYEETFSDGFKIACGLCLQSFSMATTNNKWKPGVTPVTSTSVYQLIRVESLSLYLNPNGSSSLPFYPKIWDFTNLLAWKAVMHRSLRTFAINSEEFQFLIKPFTTKIKVIMNQSNEGQAARMLVDIVLQDIAMQISDKQFAAFCLLWESLQQGFVERTKLIQKCHPVVKISENSKAWWHYACTAILEQNIRPYTWKYIKTHRENYKVYKETFIQSLLRPNDTELKLDLQKYEDCLTILNIIIAREHAKIELKENYPDCVTVESGSNIKLAVNCEKIQEICGIPSSPKPNNTNDNETKFKLELMPKYIEKKYNFTLANWSFSLFSNDREILVTTITQFLTSIETRPECLAYKISARAESLVIEGASSENDLIPLVTADNILTGNAAVNFLAIDFEKNPPNSDFNYDINVRLEAFEVTYHKYAMLEILNLFKRNKSHVQHLACSLQRGYKRTKSKCITLINSIMNRRLRINLKLDIKGPYFVFPDNGSIQEGEHIIILDLGRMTLKTELQAVEVQLEDATLMELEELLYDRIHIVLTDSQMLICHTGDDWRESRSWKDSENHVIPKIQSNVTVSFSIKPDYRLLPKLKLNVSISTLKINLSKHKLLCLNEFLNLLSIPNLDDIEEFRQSLLKIQEETSEFISLSSEQLIRVRTIVALSSFILGRDISNYSTVLPSTIITESEKSIVSSSEFSEEDLEQWIKSVNYSGFDDNISPHNHVNLLLRIVIGELCIHACSTSNGREKPYLILRLCTLYLESAIMEYGPAFQLGVGTIVLADKTNAGITGSYLELISTDGSYDIIGMSYRKVRANCPDFKSHFKSIEQSLIFNIRNLNVVFHQQAFLKIKDYCDDLKTIPFPGQIPNIIEIIKYAFNFLKKNEDDPPVPPGAIKLSYSARLHTFVLRLCTKDMDLMEIRVLGLESDCIYNANERMILTAYLRGLAIEDLSEITLYSKILTTDDDKVFDLKYVRHAPKLYSASEMKASDDVKTDGSFKLSFGKINCILLSEVFRDCWHFIEPFIHLIKSIMPAQASQLFVYWSVEELRKSATKLRIFIDFQVPTFLLPQARDVPNVILLDLGILTIENFFKINEKIRTTDESIRENYSSVLDNILIKFSSMTLSRAIMTLAGVLKIQEPIIEPVQIRLDVKRNIECRNKTGLQVYGLCEIIGSVDLLMINLSQKDLASILIIWGDNLSKIIAIHQNDTIDNESLKKKINFENEATVKKLEVFFIQDENPIREINMKITFDGLQFNLFTDSDEVLSSPVRDLNDGLGKLTLGEIIMTFELYSNKSMSMKVSLRTCILEDTRKEETVIRKIIQSPAKSAGLNFESCISVSEPPVFDFTFTQAPAGDQCIDMLIEETRFNLSIPFLLQLTRYFVDSLPAEPPDTGVVNEAYEGHAENPVEKKKVFRRFSTQNVTDLSEQSGTSVSIRVRKPEVLLFGDLKASNAHAILVQAELTIEYSRHAGISSIVCMLSNVCAKSKSQERYRRQAPQSVLHPCDIEISAKEKSPDDRAQICFDVSPVNIHLSAGVICTFSQILNDAAGIFRIIDAKFDNKNGSLESNSHIDLWSPKKIFSVPCKRNSQEPALVNEHSTQVRIFNLKPVVIHLVFEMEETIEHIPMIKAEIEVGATISSVDDRFQLESNFKIHAFCYNHNRGNWEPLIELCTQDDVAYNPWELTIRAYQVEAHELSSYCRHSWNQIKKSTPKRRRTENYNSDDDQSNEDMIFIRPNSNLTSKISLPEYTFEHDDDSDSNEEEGSEKLARSFSHLFTKDQSDEDDDSDSDHSSKCEDEGLELTPDHVAEINDCLHDHTLIKSDCWANYIIINAEERLNFTVTKNTIDIFDIILELFSKSCTEIPIVPTNVGKLSLLNKIGHTSKIELRAEEKGNSNNISRLIASKEFKIKDDSPVSAPSSPESENNIFGEQYIEYGFMDQDDKSYDNSLNNLVIFPDQSPVNIYNSLTEESLRIYIDDFEESVIFCPKWQGYKLIPLRPAKHDVRYHLVVEVTTNHHLHRTITVRSPLQFRNETSYTLGLYYKKQLAEQLQLEHIGETLNPFDDSMRIAVIEPHDIYNVPMYITYHFPIHIMPVHFGEYQVSDRGIFWKELCENLNTPRDIYCQSKDGNSNSIFGAKVTCTEHPKFERINCQVPQYLISIVPPIVFDNKLPFVIDVDVPSIDYEVRIEPGERINVYSIKCDNDTTVNFKIKNYLGAQWAGTFKLNSELERKLIKMFADGDTDAVWRPFMLCVELNKLSSWTVVIYSEYWIINKTGLPLKIQETLSNTVEIPGEDLIVFSQKKNRRKLVMLKVHQSDWSMSFGLDAISSMSLIVCKDVERKRKYRILAEIADSTLSPNFTKIVTFLPYFFVKNNTKRALRFMEENEDADLWNDLPAGHGTAFWPYTESMRMRVKWKNSQLVSQHFDFTNIGKIVLRMENGSALCVDVKGGNNSPFRIIFEKYECGDAPVRVDNLCDDLFLKLNQVNLGQVALLSPFQSVLYTWDDPTEIRELVWNIYNSKTKSYTAQFYTDGYGQETVTFRTLKRSPVMPHSNSVTKKYPNDTKFAHSVNSTSLCSSSDDSDSEAEANAPTIEKVQKNKAIVYWISYAEKKQRVLMFTQDENTFLKAKSLVDPECSKNEIFLALAGIGLSIIAESQIPNTNGRELAYVSITDSAAHWELDIGKRWKALTLELDAWMEDKYKHSSNNIEFDNYINVNFAKMHMTKPFFGKLRRTYSPGIWIHLRKSNTLTYVQGNIHRIQIDNQLHDAIFPIILRPGSKKCFSNSSGIPRLKHCIEFFFLKQTKSTHDVYKKINLIIREFHINLQEEFLIRLIKDLFPKKKDDTKHSLASRLKTDLSNVYVSLPCLPDKQDRNRSNIIELVYIAPIQLHVKFLASAEARVISQDPMDYCNIIRMMFAYASKGTFLKQAEFRLPHYERIDTMMDNEEWLFDAWKNYKSELRHQFNVLILSMTVLGNPYSYNFKCPGDSFYDTDTLVIQGDETAEKLSYNVAYLLGYSCMDGLFTPIININLFESETSRNKRKISRFESTDTPLSALTLDRSYSIGVELEMSGLIVKPSDNTHQEELKYSLKALSKGIIGISKLEDGKSSLRIQPGLILDTIKRAQEMGYNFISRIRFPRYINPYLAVELYSTYKARGMYLLNTIIKSEYANAEIYWAHAALSNDGKHIALVSLQKIYLVEKRCSIWASWHVAWSIETKELIEPPVVDGNKLILHVNKISQNQILSQTTADWYLESEDTTTLKWLSQKINTAMILNMINSRYRSG
ncbi:vacuolar protein sorting-associated protein 13A-like isoform X2 [Cotesia glomerata]|uniref:vacuolar protein sorting-associated protein 13A-like isoform X2 n=1 Tax=Cotesia glomerata TaxID=32391 RepID=UPI001D00F5DE|nr:vacuolar protein sorting-associated protein 13A-like isoform X2 [Cotesia glomerata]